jgi:LPXTG-motif cell wall-anchored protein
MPSSSSSPSTNNTADAGFTLPGAAPAAASAASAASASSVPASVSTASTGAGTIDGAPQTDTSNRDLTLAGGIFLVLLLAFFFARGAYVNHLVSRRVAPGSAGNAGWLLFIGLAFLSAAIVLALINAEKYLSLWVTGPLVLVGLGSLLGAVLTGRR